MIATAFATLASHWRRKPAQMFLLVIGLGLATALWTSVQAINAEARASYDEASAALGGGASIVLTSDEGGIDVRTWARLRRDGWAASPVIEGELVADGQVFTLTGVEPLSAPDQEGRGQLGDTALATEFMTGPGVLLTAPESADALRRSGADLPPVRASARIAPGEIVTDIAVAAELLDREDRIDAILVDPSARSGRTALSALVPELTPSTRAGQGEVSRLTGSFHLNLTAFGFLSFVVGLFIVYAAVGLAFTQRRAALRTLRALGAPVRVIVFVLVLEALALALLAGGMGVVGGYLIAAALLPDVAATLGGLYGVEVSGALSIRAQWWISGFAVAILGALAATAQSIRRAAVLPLLASAQPQAWTLASKRRNLILAGISLGFFAAAAAIAQLFAGVLAGFATLASLLIGAALILPPLLAFVLDQAGRVARGPVAEWFFADTRQQLPHLSLALMALMLALAANIGVGTMVSSFRSTFEGWLDQRLAAELYVAARDEDQSAALRAYLEPRVDAVLPIWSVQDDVAGQTGEIFGFRDHATYRDHWPLIVARPDVWEIVAAGDGVLVNEQAWRRLDLDLGDPVRLGVSPPLPLAGVYSDYGNPNAQAMIAINTLLDRFGDKVSRLRYGVRMDRDRIDGLAEALEARFDLPDDGVIDQSSVKALSLSIFERTFAVTAALNGLTFFVAGFAMFTSLSTLATMRAAQLAPVWALGLTRRRLALLELARAALLAALTWSAALPVGLALAWTLLVVVNVDAFGWRLPMRHYPSDWFRLAVLAVLTALAAGSWPAWALARRSPRHFLQIFAQER